MVLQTCVLNFSNEKAVFYGGDFVSGTISFTLTKPKKLLDLMFQAKGETKCSWTVTHNTGKKTTRVRYSSSEVHFRTNTSLVTGYPRDGGTVTLEPGNHSFGFSFTLPEDVPTSLEGHLGRVRYTIKVTASRSMKFEDAFRCPFSVITKYDLNAVPSFAVPIQLELSKSFYFFFSSKGVATIKAHLPMSGFVPGQTMQIFCEIKNHSDVKITNVHFSLLQKRTYKCTHPTTAKKEEFTKVAMYCGEGVDKKMEVSYPVTIAIPSLPPSSKYPGLITTEYFLKAKAVVSGMHSNISNSTTVTIGTVPINFAQNYYNPVNTMFPSTSYNQPGLSVHEPSAPPSEASYFGDPPAYNDLAPPTYEESQTSHMMTQADPDDKGSTTCFSPVYPVYSFPPIDYTNVQKNHHSPNIGFNVPKD